MIFKRRWFRILVVVLALVLFIGYFAFSTFLFSPHEDDFEHDVAALIPRDVDFFVAKADLRGDFDKFPHLAVLDELEDNPAFQQFIHSPEWNDYEREQDLDRTLTDLKSQLQLPLGLDLLDVFGGRDLAVAGRFKGAAFADADWMAYGRVSWAGKLGFALMKRGWLGLDAQGMAVESEKGLLRLSGGQLVRALYLARIQDVVVVGTSHELAQAALDLAARRGEGSLLASADYNDNIATVPRHEDRDELEVIVDMRDLLRNLGHQGPWPDTNAEAFLPSFLGRLFQAPSCKKMMGVIGMHDGLQLDLYGGFSSETITDTQRAIYLRRGFSKSDLLGEDGIALLAPEDCSLFVYLAGPIDVLLKQVFDSMEPSMRQNLEDSFRQTGEYQTLEQMVDYLEGGMKDRLALIVTENEYPPDTAKGGAPPNDGRPVFMISLITWFSDGGQRTSSLVKLVGENPQIFGLQGANGSGGHYTNIVDGNNIHEFWNRLVPGTGIIATFNRDDRTYVFNNHMAAGELSRTYTLGGAGGYPRLSERLDFKALMDESLDSANLLVWYNPRTAKKTLMMQAERVAIEAAGSAVAGDAAIWPSIRAEEEARVLQGSFQGKARSALSEDERKRFDLEVGEALQGRRRNLVRDLAPQLQAETERKIAWSQGVRCALVLLQLDPREFRVSVRVVAPVDG
jgi:hypothetical protein